MQGRPLRARTVGTGPRRVLWIGGIHGNEQEGVLATDQVVAAFADPVLATAATLTVLQDANPDGRANNTRTNANGVDLNRNFPAPNFDPALPEGGGAPLSQPETRAVDALLRSVRPDVVVVMHSWLGRQFVTFDGPGDELAARFGATSGMPVEPVEASTIPGALGLYAAATFGNPTLVVEFLRGLSQEQAWAMIRQASLDLIGAVALPSTGPVAVNEDGRFEAFGVSTGGTLVNTFQHAVGQGWSDWYPHPGAWPAGRQVATIRGARGRLAVFATDPDGVLLRSDQLAIGLGWSEPAPIGGGFAGRPVVARDLDGRLEVLAVGLDGRLWRTAESVPGGSLVPWTPIGSGVADVPAIGATADGRLVAAAVGTDGALRIAAQTAPNGGWSPLGTVPSAVPLAGTPGVGRNADGRLEVVVAGGGVLRHTWQEGFGWAAPVPLSGVEVDETAPAVGRNADGRLEVVFRDVAGRLGHLWQHQPGGVWSDPVVFGDRAMTLPPSLAVNGDGRLEAFALGDDGQLWHAFQLNPNSGWSPLYHLGGALSSA